MNPKGSSPLARAVRPSRETVGGRGQMEEQSYEPICTCEGRGNRRASERSVQYPLEEGGTGDVSVEGNMGETQNSSNYVHTNRQNI